MQRRGVCYYVTRRSAHWFLYMSGMLRFGTGGQALRRRHLPPMVSQSFKFSGGSWWAWAVARFPRLETHCFSVLVACFALSPPLRNHSEMSLVGVQTVCRERSTK
jgi:hypothetical protein